MVSPRALTLRLPGARAPEAHLSRVAGQLVAVAMLAVVVSLAGWSALADRGASVPVPARNESPPAMPGGAVTSEDAAATAADRAPVVQDSVERVEAARRELQRREELLGSLAPAVYRGVHTAVPVAVSGFLDRERGGQYARVGVDALRRQVDEARAALDDAEREQQRRVAEYFEAVAAAARAAPPPAASAPAVAGAASATASATASGSCAGDLACFLPCTRAHESDTAGGYAAVSPDGVYRGAYQFDRTTWDSVAASTGRADLVGVDPAASSAADQDTLASALYLMRGNQPWGGRC